MVSKETKYVDPFKHINEPHTQKLKDLGLIIDQNGILHEDEDKGVRRGRMMKKTLLIIVALLAFESFGFGFLLDAAKLAIGVSVMAVQNKISERGAG